MNLVTLFRLMFVTNRRWIGWVGLFAAVALSSCGTMGYTQLQKDFLEQVEKDNQTSASPFVSDEDADAMVAEGYRKIAGQLTDTKIAGLEPTQRANAWMLRGISSWRAKNYEDAIKASKSGLETAPTKGSRESLILGMLPGLVIDQQMADIWTEFEIESMPVQAFEEAKIQENYKTAFAQYLNPAKEEAYGSDAPTPKSVLSYMHYQRWRVIQNWDLALSRVEDREARQQLRAAADAFLGKPMPDAARREMTSIPEGDPYRQLIESKSSF